MIRAMQSILEYIYTSQYVNQIYFSDIMGIFNIFIANRRT